MNRKKMTMNTKTSRRLRRLLPTAGAWLLCASPAFATGSMLCEGPAYTVEIQSSLSTGRLTQIVIARAGDSQHAGERFALQQRFVDYRRKLMRASGTGLAQPAVKATLWISGNAGALTYRGARHTLRCDWFRGLSGPARSQSRSMIVTFAMPPPSHIVCSP